MCSVVFGEMTCLLKCGLFRSVVVVVFCLLKCCWVFLSQCCCFLFCELLCFVESCVLTLRATAHFHCTNYLMTLLTEEILLNSV